jgi:hypothetical protein
MSSSIIDRYLTHIVRETPPVKRGAFWTLLQFSQAETRVQFPLAYQICFRSHPPSSVLMVAIAAVLIVLRTIEPGQIALSGTMDRVMHTKAVGCVMIRTPAEL